MVKRVFRLIFDFEKADAWLNEMAGQGWMMESFCFGLFRFSKGSPGEYTYRTELLPHPAWSAANRPYLDFVKEAGAELVTIWVKWAVYRKKTCEGSFDIYTDTSSRTAHYRRVSRFLLFFCLLEWSLALLMGSSIVYALLSNRSGADYPYVLYAVVFLFAILVGALIFRAARRSHQRYKRLKKEEPFLE